MRILSYLLALALVASAGAGTTSDDWTVGGNLTVTGTTTLTGAQTLTGAVTLSGGATLTSGQDLACSADGGCDVGASGTEFGTAWVQTIDDGDGTVTVAAALEAGGLALDDTTDLTCDADAGCDVGASGTEFGTAWVQTIDDGDGTVTVGAILDVGSNTISQVTSKTITIPAGAMDFGTTGASEIKNNKATIALADTGADEHIYIAWGIPEDYDISASLLHVQVEYLCDNATPTEGEWDVTYLVVADDDADAALAGEVTVLDTPAAQNDWNVTAAMVLDPTGDIGADTDLIYLDVYHDVSDPLCGAADVNVAAVHLTYTTDQNY